MAHGIEQNTKFIYAQVATINIAVRDAVNQPTVSGNFLMEHLSSPRGQTSNGGLHAPEFILG